MHYIHIHTDACIHERDSCNGLYRDTIQIATSIGMRDDDTAISETVWKTHW
jgi:hypothetical protein